MVTEDEITTEQLDEYEETAADPMARQPEAEDGGKLASDLLGSEIGEVAKT